LWLAVLVGLTTSIAWRLGWIELEIKLGKSSTGSLVDADDQEFDELDFQEFAATDSEDPFKTEPANIDPAVFSEQSEPGVEEFASTQSNSTGNPFAYSQNPFANRSSVPTQQAPRQLKDNNYAQPLNPNPRSGNSATGNVNRAEPQFVQNASASSITGVRSNVVQAEAEVPKSQPPAVSQETRDLVRQIDTYIEQNEFLKAHKKLSQLYWKQPELRDALDERINRTASSIYLSPQPHYMEPYEIQPGEHLRKVAPKYKVTWEYLARLNRIDPRRVQAGQKLKVIKGPFSVFVDLSDRELIVHAHGYYVKRYKVGIGQDGSSPIGKFTVLNKVPNPQYTAPDGSVLEGDDPNNPLGEYWIDIGNSFGIHGTIDTKSVGKAESRGCIRMLDSDIAEVYDFLTDGSEVVIRQ